MFGLPHYSRTVPAVLATSILLGVVGSIHAATAVSFADNGGLKMLYDNRQFPQAVAHGDTAYIVWRDRAGKPWLRTYGLDSRKFGDPRAMLDDVVPEKLKIKESRYRKDHHFAPVIWMDGEERLHAMFGCHNTPGVHVVSKDARAPGQWMLGGSPSESMSYPKIHRIQGGRSLVYYRHTGHLGMWRYRIIEDGASDWEGPANTGVDLNAEPQDGKHAAHAGSYCTTAVNADGTRLHVAFIWKVEEPVFNELYQTTLTGHTQRYNLYYFFIDLATHQAFNIFGEPVAMPLRKSVADKKCLVWDTGERVAAVGPSIALDRHGLPHFMLPVSDKTPLDSRFHFVTWNEGKWRRVEVTPTLHPFNASHLEVLPDGEFRAFLIAGEGEEVVEEGMDEYGWGKRVEEWVYSEEGMKWERKRDLTPVGRPGWHWQNVQPVIGSDGRAIPGLLLFYGWKERNGAGTAFLWDGRGR